MRVLRINLSRQVLPQQSVPHTTHDMFLCLSISTTVPTCETSTSACVPVVSIGRPHASTYARVCKHLPARVYARALAPLPKSRCHGTWRSSRSDTTTGRTRRMIPGQRQTNEMIFKKQLTNLVKMEISFILTVV